MSEEIQKSALEVQLMDYLKKVIYLLIFCHYLFNILEFPALKFIYALEVVCIIGYLVREGWQKAAPFVLALAFVEGQGRVIWGYHPAARIVFDVSLLVAITFQVIRTKSLIPKKGLPLFLLGAIGLHFLWYTVQLFNVNSVGFFGVLAAGKIYIFPFLLFFMFMNEPVNDRDHLKSLQNMALVLIISQSILAVYQMSLGADHLLAINPYYANPMKDGIFTGKLFRPFGTSFNAGGFSTFYFLSVGFLFVRPRALWFRLTRTLVLTVGLGALVISQVRAATVKYALVIAGVSVLLVVIQKGRFKSLLLNLGVIALVGIGGWNSGVIDTVEFDLTTSIERFQTLAKLETLQGERIGISDFFTIISKKLSDNFIGLGPGRTGAAAQISSSKIINDPFYGLSASWANDNLWVSLVIDLGIGFLIYSFIIFVIPMKLLYGAIKDLSRGREKYQVLAVSGVTCFVVLIGNWGAIGLPYNPESFLFWLWAAIGLREYYGCMETVT